MEEAQNTIKEFEKQKNYNNLIPSLMQEIQELRQASKSNNERQELQNHFNQLEKNLMEKVGSELETVSTLKSTEEDELQEKYRLTCFELEKKNQETLANRERMKEL